MWDHLSEATDPFLVVRMVEMGTPDLRKLQKFCVGRVPVILHPALYRALKLTYQTGIVGIVLDGRMMTGMGKESLGQPVVVLSSADFSPVRD